MFIALSCVLKHIAREWRKVRGAREYKREQEGEKPNKDERGIKRAGLHPKPKPPRLQLTTALSLCPDCLPLHVAMLLVSWSSGPQRAKSPQSSKVVSHCEQSACGLACGEYAVHLLEGLLTKTVSLFYE